MRSKVEKALTAILGVIGLLLIGFGISMAVAQESKKEDSLVISKETLMEIQSLLQQQQQQVAAEHEMAKHWYTKYQNTRQCVVKSESHYQALNCVGIVTASNENK